MKIKTSIFIVIIFGLLLPLNIIAQKNFTQEADIAFEDQQYYTAVDKYKKAYTKIKSNRVEKNRILFQIGECYRLTNNSKRAETQYKRLLRVKYYKQNPKVYLYYADALKINQKYEEAIIAYNQYKELVPNDPLGEIGTESCVMAQKWKDNPTRYLTENEKKFNSRDDDFSPAFADKKYNSLLFTSSRDGSTGNSIDDWTGQNFSDIFIVKKDRKGEWSSPALVDKDNLLNTVSNEGQPSFNERFNTLYFTRCVQEKKMKLGCQIYLSRKKGRGWGEGELVQIGRDTSATIGHPSISGDELTIYFASDMEGGYGGRDIWYATRDRKSKPFKNVTNCGPAVNTAGDEVFPFFRSDTVLYFASNGHVGMGGLDIYRAVKTNDKWAGVTNMKYPMNSNADDFGIIFFPGQEEGYLSSNRKGGRGGDDLYYFIRPPLEYTLQGEVKDDRTLQFITGAVVKIVGSDGSSIEDKTDASGFYSFDKTQILVNTSYELFVSKDGYFSDDGRMTTVGLQINKDFVMNFILKPIPKEPILLPEILYDLAKWDLKPQYQDSLIDLIETLEKNETLTIELAAHTDTRDTDEKNDILSQKRAQSVVDYLITRGIDPDRLDARGYGERVPRKLMKNINRDGYDFLTGVTLTDDYINSLSSRKEKEAAHQLNRRTEFTVLSFNFVPKQKNLEVAENDTTVKTKSIVDIVIDPYENIVDFTLLEGGGIEAPCIINNFLTNFIFNKETEGFNISLAAAVDLLSKGYISKTDFLGDIEEALGGGTIANNAVFVIKTLRIGENNINDVEATVNYTQEIDIKIGDQILSKFGSYTIDEEKSQIILR